MNSNRKRGRPSLSGETGQRYQVTIPPSIADNLRQLGDGSLSQGIIRAARRYEWVRDIANEDLAYKLVRSFIGCDLDAVIDEELRKPKAARRRHE